MLLSRQQPLPPKLFSKCTPVQFNLKMKNFDTRVVGVKGFEFQQQAMYKIVDRSVNIKALECGIKNKFNWSWLEEKDKHGDFMSDYIRKIDTPGYALCTWCNDKLKYGSTGRKDLKNHSVREKHVKARKLIKSNETLPGLFASSQTAIACTMPNNDTSVPDSLNNNCNLPYGTAENIHKGSICANRQPITKPNTSFQDRKSHIEATLLYFVAEHSLPLSITPHLVGLSKELSRDHKALGSLSMDGSTASYKLREGIGLMNNKRLANDLKNNFFSMNMDECTSANNQKVFSILVSFFSDTEKEAVVKHYNSVSMVVVNAKVLFETVTGMLEKDGIALDNLISNLSDSTNYMRGKKTGFETRLREVAPHLLDIDGDICHHVHNSVKRFCQHFDSQVERLDDDLHTDFKYSTDLRDYLQEICRLLSIAYLTPTQRVAHRWLSAYDVTERNLQMMNAFTVFYFAWIPQNLKEAYMEFVTEILKSTSQKCRQRIFEILKILKQKNLTEDGKKRKARIVDKIFYDHKKTLIVMNLYCSVLPLFKSFVLLFEQKQPMCHRLHDEITELFASFLACFIKHESVKGLNATKLQNLDVQNKKIHLSSRNIFIGDKAEKIIGGLHETDTLRTSIYTTVLEGYTDAAQYMQKKFPLSNQLLKCLSAIDPRASGHSVSFNRLKQLKAFFPTVLKDEEADTYLKEISKFQVDPTLPEPTGVDGTLLRLDHWWAKLFADGQYPVFSKVVKACLSIFTGPRIEQSFSVMNDLIGAKSNRLKIETYSAIQSVKYDIASKHTSTLKMFHREDIQKDPVDKSLAYHMQTAYGRYKRKNLALNKERGDTAKVLKLSKPMHPPQSTVTKKSRVHKLADDIKKKINQKKVRR